MAAKTNYTPKVTAQEGGGRNGASSYGWSNTNYKEPQRKQQPNAWNTRDQNQALDNFDSRSQQQADVYSAMANQNATGAFGRQAAIDSMRGGNQYALDSQQIFGNLQQTRMQTQSQENIAKARIVGDTYNTMLNNSKDYALGMEQTEAQRYGIDSQERQNALSTAGGMYSSLIGSLSSLNNMAVNYWR